MKLKLKETFDPRKIQRGKPVMSGATRALMRLQRSARMGQRQMGQKVNPHNSKGSALAGRDFGQTDLNAKKLGQAVPQAHRRTEEAGRQAADPRRPAPEARVNRFRSNLRNKMNVSFRKGREEKTMGEGLSPAAKEMLSKHRSYKAKMTLKGIGDARQDWKDGPENKGGISTPHKVSGKRVEKTLDMRDSHRKDILKIGKNLPMRGKSSTSKVKRLSKLANKSSELGRRKGTESYEKEIQGNMREGLSQAAKKMLSKHRSNMKRMGDSGTEAGKEYRVKKGHLPRRSLDKADQKKAFEVIGTSHDHEKEMLKIGRNIPLKMGHSMSSLVKRLAKVSRGSKRKGLFRYSDKYKKEATKPMREGTTYKVNFAKSATIKNGGTLPTGEDSAKKLKKVENAKGAGSDSQENQGKAGQPVKKHPSVEVKMAGVLPSSEVAGAVSSKNGRTPGKGSGQDNENKGKTDKKVTFGKSASIKNAGTLPSAEESGAKIARIGLSKRKELEEGSSSRARIFRKRDKHIKNFNSSPEWERDYENLRLRRKTKFKDAIDRIESAPKGTIGLSKKKKLAEGFKSKLKKLILRVSPVLSPEDKAKAGMDNPRHGTGKGPKAKKKTWKTDKSGTVKPEDRYGEDTGTMGIHNEATRGEPKDPADRKDQRQKRQGWPQVFYSNGVRVYALKRRRGYLGFDRRADSDSLIKHPRPSKEVQKSLKRKLKKKYFKEGCSPSYTKDFSSEDPYPYKEELARFKRRGKKTAKRAGTKEERKAKKQFKLKEGKTTGSDPIATGERVGRFMTKNKVKFPGSRTRKIGYRVMDKATKDVDDQSKREVEGGRAFSNYFKGYGKGRYQANEGKTTGSNPQATGLRIGRAYQKGNLNFRKGKSPLKRVSALEGKVGLKALAKSKSRGSSGGEAFNSAKSQFNKGFGDSGRESIHGSRKARTLNRADRKADKEMKKKYNIPFGRKGKK